jgi:hypothetical protein
VMAKSHAVDQGLEQPTPAQPKELFSQIETGRVDKSRMQEFLRGSTQGLTIEIARSIVGNKNFFGPEEWNRFFGNKFQIANIPEIPWSQAELKSPGISQTHFLFLGIDKLDGKPLSLSTWYKLCSGGKHPKIYSDWYLNHKFAQVTYELRWYLMPIGIVEGSQSLSYDRQVDLLPDVYEVPTAPARVTANILYYQLNGRYLDTDCWSRISDKSDGGYRVFLRGDSGIGVFVDFWYDGASVSIGVAASRKF